MSNKQKPEAFAKGDGSTLDLHSIFLTIQGEGPFIGRRAVFIRLAGCNLQCPGCDTEYTEGRSVVPSNDIVESVNTLSRQLGPKPLVVMTGGEPFRQPIGRLVDALVTAGYDVQIESNGVFAPCPTVEYLCMVGRVTLVISPKTVRVNENAARLANVWKYVLDHRSIADVDGLPLQALGHPAATGVARPPWALVDRARVYVNPYDAKDDALNARNMEAVVQSVLRFGYVAGVQMHKMLGVE